MRRFRPLLAFVFSGMIVFGIWKWYGMHQDVQFIDPLRPLWGRITYTLQDIAQGLRSETPKANDTQRIPQLASDFSEGTLSTTEVTSLLKQLPTKGAPDARVVIIEYCHYDSTYCKQAYDDGAVLAYQAAFPQQTQYAFLPMLPSNDESTALPHVATQCAQQLGTTKQYFAFHSLQYEQYDTTVAGLLADAQLLGIKGMEDCLTSLGQRLALQKNVKQAKALFGIKSLPTYIVLNKQTGKYVKIPGLYEEKEVLDALAYSLQ